MKNVETVICSAIWYKELLTPIYRPTNVDEGIVFAGHRHPHCIHQMGAMTGKRQAEVGKYEQWYLTNYNRFMGREEAAKIALSSGQIKKMEYTDGETLYSEDLFPY